MVMLFRYPRSFMQSEELRWLIFSYITFQLDPILYRKAQRPAYTDPLYLDLDQLLLRLLCDCLFLCNGDCLRLTDYGIIDSLPSAINLVSLGYIPLSVLWCVKRSK